MGNGNCGRCLEVVCNLCEHGLCDHMHDDPSEWEQLAISTSVEDRGVLESSNKNVVTLHQHFHLSIMGMTSGGLHEEVTCQKFSVHVTEIENLIEILRAELSRSEND